MKLKDITENESFEQFVEFIAQITHEANRAYCDSLGDFSQSLWDEAEDWQKESAMQGVRYRLEHLDDNLSPSDMHENWMKVKQADGWKYGPIKDPERKQHPCMVSYDQLPPEQQFKDQLFSTLVYTAMKGAIELFETQEI